MSALQHFFDAERLRRGWSMREIAERSKISPSKAYAIVNGDDNVEFETFENIATAFSMTPADLAVAIGKGATGQDPRRVALAARLRDVPDDELGFFEHAVSFFTGRRRANARLSRGANKRQADVSTATNTDDSGSDGTVMLLYPRYLATLAPSVL